MKDYKRESKIDLKAIKKIDNYFYLKGYLLNQKTLSKGNSTQYQYTFKSKKLYSIWRKKVRIASDIDEFSLKKNKYEVTWNYWNGKIWQQIT